MPVGLVVIASIQSSQHPVPSTDTTPQGRVLLGQAHFAKLSKADSDLARELEASGRTIIEQERDLFVTSINAARNGSDWIVRAEVVGPTVPDPDRVKKVESALGQEIGAPVKLTLWARTEIVVTGERYDSVDHIIEAEVRRRLQGLADDEPTS